MQSAREEVTGEMPEEARHGLPWCWPGAATQDWLIPTAMGSDKASEMLQSTEAG